MAAEAAHAAAAAAAGHEDNKCLIVDCGLAAALVAALRPAAHSGDSDGRDSNSSMLDSRLISGAVPRLQHNLCAIFTGCQ